MAERRPHPSGRPLRRLVWGTETCSRIPREEPLTPSLRRREQPPAIGFVHDMTQWSDDDDA